MQKFRLKYVIHTSTKFSADFRSKRYGIGKEKGRAIADSTFTES